MTKRTTILLFVALSLLCSSFAQDKGVAPGATSPPAAQGQIKDKFHVVQVDHFEVKAGVEFPAEYLKNLQEEISRQLVSSKVFENALQAGQQPASPGAPVIRLSGTIHNYKEGSRTKRYLVGYGAGASEVDARAVFSDAATGQTLVVQEVRAMLAGGLFGGKEEKVTQELARQIVTQSKLMTRRRLPAAGESASSSSGAQGNAAPPEQHTLTLDSKHWEEAEEKLNREAAAGFQVVNFSLTGSKTAELELEKTAAPPDVYQYRWARVRLANHLQRDVNKATADGFHASIHTLAWLGSFLSVLMEKPPIPLVAKYEYLIAEPLRVSSAQKDTETRESQGYTLLDEADAGGFHVLLFEKVTETAVTEETKK
jgi:hypothetical protein